MTAELNPIDLFMQAGLVVRGVAVALGILSLWCWAIIANATIGLFKVKAARRALEREGERQEATGVVRSGLDEAARSFTGESLSDRRQRIQGTMRRHVQAYIERCQGSLGSLAVIASVAPFIGLFGTVWGIMTSFVGIAAAKDTSLAVVAPGIAEALAATALGLAAAIPAAFAYNRLVTAFGKVGRDMTRRVDAMVPAIAEAAPAFLRNKVA